MPKKDDKSADPFADWSDEDKAEWDASAKFRERARQEDHDSLLDSIKNLIFDEPDGGGVLDADGDNGTESPGEVEGGGSAGTGGGSLPPLTKVPFWDRKIGGGRKKAPANATPNGSKS